jgi:hypothetical protein
MNQDGHSLGLQAQDLDAELSRLRASLKQSERIQGELDRRVFHLKTLYDVSKNFFSSVEPETILRNGLLMADALRVSAHIPGPGTRKMATLIMLYNEEHQLALNRLMEEFSSRVKELGVVLKAADFQEV